MRQNFARFYNWKGFKILSYPPTTTSFRNKGNQTSLPPLYHTAYSVSFSAHNNLMWYNTLTLQLREQAKRD